MCKVYQIEGRHWNIGLQVYLCNPVTYWNQFWMTFTHVLDQLIGPYISPLLNSDISHVRTAKNFACTEGYASEAPERNRNRCGLTNHFLTPYDYTLQIPGTGVIRNWFMCSSGWFNPSNFCWVVVCKNSSWRWTSCKPRWNCMLKWTVLLINFNERTTHGVEFLIAGKDNTHSTLDTFFGCNFDMKIQELRHSI